jgi:hypothetical protein
MDGEWVGEHVTKDIYIETDGRHAFLRRRPDLRRRGRRDDPRDGNL